MKPVCVGRANSCKDIWRFYYPYALHARLSYWQWTEVRGFSRMETQPDYSKWSTDELVERVIYLERQLQSQKSK